MIDQPGSDDSLESDSNPTSAVTGSGVRLLQREREILPVDDGSKSSVRSSSIDLAERERHVTGGRLSGRSTSSDEGRGTAVTNVAAAAPATSS